MSTYAARRLKWFCTSALGRTAWVLGALVAATPVAAQDATQGRALLVRASEHFGQIDGLCAEFEQTMVVPLLGSEVRSRGQLCQRPPHFFAMDSPTRLATASSPTARTCGSTIPVPNLGRSSGRLCRPPERWISTASSSPIRS